MSPKAFLVESISKVMQKIFQITRRLGDNTKEETDNLRIYGEVYDFGCSPVSDKTIVQGLKHGGSYPIEIEH